VTRRANTDWFSSTETGKQRGEEIFADSVTNFRVFEQQDKGPYRVVPFRGIFVWAIIDGRTQDFDFLENTLHSFIHRLSHASCNVLRQPLPHLVSPRGRFLCGPLLWGELCIGLPHLPLFGQLCLWFIAQEDHNASLGIVDPVPMASLQTEASSRLSQLPNPIDFFCQLFDIFLFSRRHVLQFFSLSVYVLSEPMQNVLVW
jgi:hypothetical protein